MCTKAIISSCIFCILIHVVDLQEFKIIYFIISKKREKKIFFKKMLYSQFAKNTIKGNALD